MHQAPNVRQDQIKFSPVWTPDFKGQIETMDGPYCYPLTVFECYARFLPGCQALDAPPGAAKSAGLPPLLFHVWSARFYPNRQRHPLRLLQALSRTSRLSIWWVPLGTPSRAHSPTGAVSASLAAQEWAPKPLHGTLEGEANNSPGGKDSDTTLPAFVANSTGTAERSVAATTSRRIETMPPRPFPQKLPTYTTPPTEKYGLSVSTGDIPWENPSGSHQSRVALTTHRHGTP